MKGLLLKDFLSLKKQGKILVALFVFYMFFTVYSKNISMLVMMVTLMVSMMPITTMSYDETCKWDKYALSMPISRKTIILSKYLFGIIFDLAGLVFVLILSGFYILLTKESEIVETLITPIAFGAIALVFLAFILPILFKFGVEKGRLLMFIVFSIPTILVMFLSKQGVTAPSLQTIKLLLYISPAIILLILFISIKVSIMIYDKKEF